MLAILLNAVLPVVVIAGLGVIIGRIFKLDARPISRLTLYVFSPALIFWSLSMADISFGEVTGVFLFLAVWTPVMYAVTWAIGWQLRMKGKTRNAFFLSTLFPNAVNYGLPVSLFAFGQAGMDRALLFLAPTALLSGTLAIWVASGGGAGGWRSLLPLLRVPTFYATVAALAINPLDVAFPEIIARPLQTLGGAAIPSMLMVLGLQLSQASFKEDLVRGGVAAIVRLLVGPAVAYPCTLLLGIEGVTQQVVIVLAGMPTAVFTIILATEFETRPNQVTSAVAVSTTASMATLTVLIWAVQRVL
ncbi:MAG: AEC family transporter [Chloroflexi bacterium]|nr:AEC family transporter [Chloroflexota bacterium]